MPSADSAPAAPAPTAEAETVEDDTEVLRAVVRISWNMIDRLADDQITAEVPFESPIMGGRMAGRVSSKADISIALEEHPEHAHFNIGATGTARGTFNASRDNISVSGPLAIPFRATQEVIFDGRQFSSHPARVQANVNVQFQCISRSGLFPNLGRRIVANAAERERPAVEQAAQPIAERYLTNFVDTEAEQLVAQLNQVTNLENSVLRVYPQLKDWRVRLSSTEEHLEAHYAPPGSDPLVLPDSLRRPDNAGLEIWVRTTAAEARLLERIGNWNQSQQLLKNFLEGHSVDVADMASDAKVVAIDNWIVVAMGKAIESTDLTSNTPTESSAEPTTD